MLLRELTESPLAKVLRHIKDLDDLERSIRKSPAGIDKDTEQKINDRRKQLMRKKQELGEEATAGATSAGNIASVANPKQAYGHRPKDKKGLPKAPQKKNKDGTAKNALDIDDSLMGGKAIKR